MTYYGNCVQWPETGLREGREVDGVARSVLAKRLRPYLKRRSEWLSYPLWLLEAALIAVFWMLSALLPVTRASRLGAAVVRALGPRLYKHRHVRANLATAFPDWDPRRLDEVSKEVWANLGSVLAEYPHLSRILEGHETDDGRVHTQIDQAVRELVRNSRPFMVLGGHLANWELIAAVVVTLGVPLTAVYSPQSNPLVDRMIQRFRKALGCEFVAKSDAVRELMRELKRGRSVGMLPDQRVDSGREVMFFGRLTPSTRSPARVAVRMNCPIVPARVERLADARFRVTLYAPLESDETDPDARADALTDAFFALLEKWITQHPEQWLCSKRRFAKDADWRARAA